MSVFSVVFVGLEQTVVKTVNSKQLVNGNNTTSMKKVLATGPGLKSASVNSDAVFTVDASHAGMSSTITSRLFCITLIFYLVLP